MTKKARFTQGQITKLLKGAQSAGMKVSRLTIEPDGTLTLDLENPGASSAPNEWDEVLNNPRPLPRKRKRPPG